VFTKAAHTTRGIDSQLRKLNRTLEQIAPQRLICSPQKDAKCCASWRNVHKISLEDKPVAKLKTIVARTALAAAAFAALGLASASAETPYASPDGRITLTMPDGWVADVMSDPGAPVFHIAIGTAAQECRVVLPNNPVTTTVSTGTIKRTFSNQFTADQWNTVISGFPFVRGGTLVTNGVDESGFWPRQTAEILHEGRTVYGSIQGRQGYDIYAFCTSFDGPDVPAVYSAVLRSIGAAGDAAAQTAYEAEAATRAAAAPAAPPAAPPPEQPRGRRQN
jgi:hypothetical protein